MCPRKRALPSVSPRRAISSPSATPSGGLLRRSPAAGSWPHGCGRSRSPEAEQTFLCRPPFRRRGGSSPGRRWQQSGRSPPSPNRTGPSPFRRRRAESSSATGPCHSTQLFMYSSCSGVILSSRMFSEASFASMTALSMTPGTS
ncbi:hypothetical protein SDC9_58233 [bioreactor metagenome]|uniref:Uncharacterized protein n=1 Tax=bioreactor metagenome TaxID=1076179 RepID=A0A644X6U5_9ZZZZ